MLPQRWELASQEALLDLARRSLRCDVVKSRGRWHNWRAVVDATKCFIGGANSFLVGAHIHPAVVRNTSKYLLRSVMSGRLAIANCIPGFKFGILGVASGSMADVPIEVDPVCVGQVLQ